MVHSKMVKAVGSVILGTSAMVLTTQAFAGTAACNNRVNNTREKLQECVTVDGVRQHQAAFQAHADAHNGIRTSGTPGHKASVDYVAAALTDAGYQVMVQPFDFQTFLLLSPTVLEQVAPVSPLVNNIMSYSGSGDVTANVSTLGGITGCLAADFAGFPVGNIALISRGDCSFAIKATNAFNAGAAGVIIYNNVAGTLNGTLGAAFDLDIPVTSVTQDLGAELVTAASAGLVLHLKTETLRGTVTSYNVLAESKGGDPNNVVMVGAHLDSVNEGPGIQDNGSGSAAILETALQMAKVKPRNKVRFAWWGAEEAGLVGSTHYVDSLSSDELDRIKLYLNFDMIGSPNFVYFIYDGDDSDAVGAGPGPEGSAQIESLFENFYMQRGIAFKGTDFSGRSDYGPFIAKGIPAGGLFTGAEGIKTIYESGVWGGVAGEQYDPCYHLACDTYDNISLTALDINADAVADSVLQYSMNLQSITGKRGKGNFRLPEYLGPRQQR